jgi:hypothetical protein
VHKRCVKVKEEAQAQNVACKVFWRAVKEYAYEDSPRRAPGAREKQEERLVLKPRSQPNQKIINGLNLFSIRAKRG